MNILSYNFYSRPRHIFWDNQVIRAEQFVKKLMYYEKINYCKIDVLFLQEIFDNKVNDILKEHLTELGFIYKTHRVKKFMKLNGGGLIYSRFPIVEQSNMTFKKAQIFNVASAKGMNFAKIVKRGKVYCCFNIHLDSFDSKFRLEQMKQMEEYIYVRTTDKDKIIIGGDWNIDILGDELKNIWKVFDYSIPRVDFNTSSSTVSKRNSWIQRRITKDNDEDDKDQFLDFFIIKGNMSAEMKVVEFELKQTAHDILYSPPFFLNIYKWKKDLLVNEISDHYAILGKFH